MSLVHNIDGHPRAIQMHMEEIGHWLWNDHFGWHDCSPSEDDEIARGLDMRIRIHLVEMAAREWDRGLRGRILSRRRCASMALNVALFFESEARISSDPELSLAKAERFLGWAASMERGVQPG